MDLVRIKRLIGEMDGHSGTGVELTILNGEFDWDEHVIIDRWLFDELKDFFKAM